MESKFKNFVSLAAIQVANATLPLLIFPYALSVLGATHYADIVFSEVLSVIAISVVLYSFEIDAVAKVAGLTLKNHTYQISRIFSQVLYTRLCLFLVIAPLLILGTFLYRPELWHLTFWWMLVPLSYALQPTWMFLGLQQNGAPAVCVILTRAAAVFLIFVFVHEPQDKLFFPIIIGTCQLCGSLLMIAWAYRSLKLRLTCTSLSEIRTHIKEGKEIFFSNIGVTIYRDSNVILLGIIGLSSMEIATYSLAEKITKAVQAATRPLSMVFFPRAVVEIKKIGRISRQAGLTLGKLTLPQLGILAVLWAGLFGTYQLLIAYFSFANTIPELDTSMMLLPIMSIVTLFGVANFMFGSIGLNILSEKKYMLQAILIAAVVSVVATLILGSFFNATGACISLVLAEGVLYMLILYRYYKNS